MATTKPKFSKEQHDAMKVTTPVGILSHPHLFTPSKYQDSAKESFSAEFLLPKATTDLKPIQRALHAAKVAMWGPDKTMWPEALKSPLKDGDKPMGKKRELKPERAGHWVLKAASSADYRPAVVGKDNKPAKQADIYPGCLVIAALKANPYDDGVSFVLDGVKKTGDGKPLGGGKRSVDEMFGPASGFDEDDIGEDSFENFDDSAESFDEA